MANTNISSYIGDLQSFDAATSAANKLKADSFDLKEKGLETAKAIGEAKVFLSGKPVSNYLYRQGRKMASEAIDRGVKSLSEFRDAYQTNLEEGFSKATNLAGQANVSYPTVIATRSAASGPIQMEELGDVESGIAPELGGVESRVATTVGRGIGENALSNSGYGTINTFGTVNRAKNHYAAKDYFDSDEDDPEELANPEEEQAAARATGAAANPTYESVGAASRAAVNPTYESFAGNTEKLYDNALDEGNIYDNAIDNSTRAVENPIYDTARGGLENPVYDNLQDNTNALPTPPKPSGTLDDETADIKDTAKDEAKDGPVDDDGVPIPKGKGVGEGEAGAEEKAVVEGTEDATDATLDSIPGADIIGVIAGAALAIRSAVKASRDHVKQAVDRVNSSFQVGI